MPARRFRNAGTEAIRIACELIVPAGHTSLPIELGGLVVTPAGELMIEREKLAGRLQIEATATLEDQITCPGGGPGIQSKWIAPVDGVVAVGHKLRITAIGTEAVDAGHTHRSYTALNETTNLSGTIKAFELFGVNQRVEVLGLATATFVMSGTTYRPCLIKPL